MTTPANKQSARGLGDAPALVRSTQRRRKGMVGVVAAVLVEAVVLGLPAPHNIGHQTVVADVDHGEQITISRPQSSIPSVLLHFHSSPGEPVNAIFDGARVSASSLQALAGGGPVPPHMDEMSNLRLTFNGSAGHLKGYGYDLVVMPKSAPNPNNGELQMPSTIHLQQSIGAVAPYQSTIQISADATLSIDLMFSSSTKAKALPRDGFIQIDPGPMIWRPTVPCGVPIHVELESGSMFHFSAGTGADPAGASLMQDVDGKPITWTAQSVSVEKLAEDQDPGDRARQAVAGPARRLRLISTHVLKPTSTLSIKSIRSTPGQVKVDVDGEAIEMPAGPGSPTLFNYIRTHPIFGVLLVLINLPIVLLYRRSMRG